MKRRMEEGRERMTREVLGKKEERVRGIEEEMEEGSVIYRYYSTKQQEA